MNKFALIYDKVKEEKVKVVQNKPIIISISDKEFTSVTLARILSRLKYLRKYYWRFDKKVIIDLGKITFADKITYLLFDMIIYDLFENTSFSVDLKVNIDLMHIVNQGIKSTAFYRATDPKTRRFERNSFLQEYQRKLAVGEDYYRRYVTRAGLEHNLQLPSVIVSDIIAFLRPKFEDEKWIEEVGEVVGELLDNTFSHTQSDCLVDIDVCHASDHNNQSYKILYIAVINFSEDRIFDQIKENIILEKYPRNDSLYNDIYAAYDNHKVFFSPDYEEDDFFQITAFQEGVTSRTILSGNAGKGLTSLIRNIVGKTHESFSYVLSGRNILFFKDNYMNIHKNGYIGFNETADYIVKGPSMNVISKSGLYIPGTIFHLSLVKNSEVKHGEQN